MGVTGKGMEIDNVIYKMANHPTISAWFTFWTARS